MANIKTNDDLRARLSVVLPKDQTFNIYHLSTPPTKCEPLCSPPPGERPDRTYCERHFLNVSIDQPLPEAEKRQVFVLGVEIFIFTTARATTIFVSKADSTGYLHLLNLPAGTPSPIREVCVTFIKFLVEKRQRKDVQLVVSLFARAQAQYLFPGSVDNKGKHVLDDRGLVKWWCRVLDPLLHDTVRGYLIVPGLDDYETRAVVPRGGSASGRWTMGHPLERISHYTREFDWVPPRCLIPRYPDDPKSRFRDELDEEAAKTGLFRTTGGWKSVRTLDTFWEMMAYRQECSSGRVTGFIWVVFDDEEDDKKSDQGKALPTPDASFKERPSTAPETPKKQRTLSNVTPTTTPRKLFPTKSDSKPVDEKKQKKKEKEKKKKKKLRGIIIPRQPRVKVSQRNYLLDHPVQTAYYFWDPAGRGERIFSESDYKRIVELLLHLDFATLDKAASSTRRWVNEVGLGATWGYAVSGTRELEAASQKSITQSEGNGQQVNNLTGLVKRKRNDSGSATAGDVNVLGAGLIRKKPKTEEEPSKPAVNVLGEGLVRKKPKA